MVEGIVNYLIALALFFPVFGICIYFRWKRWKELKKQREEKARQLAATFGKEDPVETLLRKSIREGKARRIEGEGESAGRCG